VQWFYYRGIGAAIQMLFQNPQWTAMVGTGREVEGSWYSSPSALRMQDKMQRCYPDHELYPSFLSSKRMSVYHLGVDGFKKYRFKDTTTSE
jgi:hypothetical protein